ncbi:hypothetical protein HDU98_009272 [Podochytrium sp. JEL0797]|nr:hypothetical protein HDU98_009272 [Podochytrium sp. JEL0797]
MPKRELDDFIDDGDEGDKKKDVKTKKTKQVKKEAPRDDEDKVVHNLSNRRKAQLGEFKGFRYADIREFYEEKGTGEWKPGKKGITLNKNELIELKKVIDTLIEGLE